MLGILWLYDGWFSFFFRFFFWGGGGMCRFPRISILCV